MRVERAKSFFRRNSLSIGVVVIFAALMGILLMLAASNARLEEQIAKQNETLATVKGITDQIAEAAAQRTEQINGIDRHLDCIVLFFTVEDRANRKITDIDTCQTVNTSTGSILQQSLDGNNPIETTPTTPVGRTENQAPTNSAPANPTPTQEATPQPNFLERNIIQPIGNFLDGLLGVQ